MYVYHVSLPISSLPLLSPTRIRSSDPYSPVMQCLRKATPFLFLSGDNFDIVFLTSDL